MKQTGILYRHQPKPSIDEEGFAGNKDPDDGVGDLEIDVRRSPLGVIENGLLMGDVTQQNQAVMIQMHPGELKEKPQIGVGIDFLLLGGDTLLYEHRIRQQLEADGFMIQHLAVEVSDSSVNIDIDANY